MKNFGLIMIIACITLLAGTKMLNDYLNYRYAALMAEQELIKSMQETERLRLITESLRKDRMMVTITGD